MCKTITVHLVKCVAQQWHYLYENFAILLTHFQWVHSISDTERTCHLPFNHGWNHGQYNKIVASKLFDAANMNGFNKCHWRYILDVVYKIAILELSDYLVCISHASTILSILWQCGHAVWHDLRWRGSQRCHELTGHAFSPLWINLKVAD